jgi:hypothetical protein
MVMVDTAHLQRRRLCLHDDADPYPAREARRRHWASPARHMVPAILRHMDERGWPTCPYVNPVLESPDQGIEHTLEVPRFSTGYAALHHTIASCPNAHAESLCRPLCGHDAALGGDGARSSPPTTANRSRRCAGKRARTGNALPVWPVQWRIRLRPAIDLYRFKVSRAVHKPSTLGHYLRLAYDRGKPWERDIAVYDRAPSAPWWTHPALPDPAGLARSDGAFAVERRAIRAARRGPGVAGPGVPRRYR